MKFRLIHLTAITCVMTCWTTPAWAWFFFIPGSVISAVSDAITGSTGDICVKEGAKVGDVLTSPAGNTGTIVSTSGASSRCQQKELPIRAEVKFDFKFNSRAGIDLPSSYTAGELTALERFNGFLLKAEDKPRTIGINIQATVKKPGSHGGTIAQSIAKSMSVAVDDAQVSGEDEFDLNGFHVFRFILTGKNKGIFGRKFTYVTSVLDNGKELVVVKIWCLESDFATNKEELLGAAGKIKFDIPRMDVQQASPVAPTPPVPDTSLLGPTADSPSAPPPVAEPSENAHAKAPVPAATAVPASTPPTVIALPTTPPVAQGPAKDLAPAAVTGTKSSSSAFDATVIADKLRALDQLRKEKLITDKDYEEKKRELLKLL